MRTTYVGVAVLLGVLALGRSAQVVSRASGLDFYLPWAVATVFDASGRTLGSPYAERERYVAAVRDYVDRSEDRKLIGISRWRERNLGGLTATPLLYASFSLLPDQYSLALRLFGAIQLALYGAGLACLGWFFRHDLLLPTALGALLLVAFGPLVEDLAFANVNAVQFSGVTALLAIAVAAGRSPAPRSAVQLGAVALTLAALLVVFKPTVALIAALVAAHLWVRLGTRAFAAAMLPALGAAALFLAVPCLYFRGWGIWHDWYARAGGRGGMGALLTRPGGGINQAGTMMVARWLGGDLLRAELALGIILAGSLLVAAVERCRAAPRLGGLVRGLADCRERLLGEAGMAITAGVAVTLALAPLTWHHYYVLILVPGLWLMACPSGSAVDRVLGLTAVAMASGTIETLLEFVGVRPGGRVLTAFSWAPLWASVVLRLWPERSVRLEAPTARERHGG